MVVPQAVKSILLECLHFIWHLYNKIVLLLIHIYYYLLLSIEESSGFLEPIKTIITNSIGGKRKLENGESNGHNENSINDINSLNYPHNLYRKILRIPDHIAIAYTNEAKSLDMDSVVRLLCWCKQLGITNVTLYDDFGSLKRRQIEIIEEFEIKMKELGGYGPKSTNRIEGLNIISKVDGRPKFLNYAKDLIGSNKNGEKIDLKKAQAKIGWQSDPELLISFGTPLCLYGFPPWQLRLTEILTIPTHRYLPQRIFINCLERYSRTSQRVGV